MANEINVESMGNMRILTTVNDHIVFESRQSYKILSHFPSLFIFSGMSGLKRYVCLENLLQAISFTLEYS